MKIETDGELVITLHNCARYVEERFSGNCLMSREIRQLADKLSDITKSESDGVAHNKYYYDIDRNRV